MPRSKAASKTPRTRRGASSSPAKDDSVLTKEPVAADDASAAEENGGGVATATEPEAQASGPENSPDILVNFVQLGTADEAPISLPAGSTVGDLLEEVGLSAKHGAVLVNNQHAGLEDALVQGANVVFATNIKGGQF